MTDSIRQQIITNIDTRFKTIVITTPPVYKTDLGKNIFWWRDLENKPFQASEVPGANLKDSLKTEPFTMGYDLNTLDIEIFITATTIEGIRNEIWDIKKAVISDVKWSSLAFDTRVYSDESKMEHLENKYFATTIMMTVQYSTAMGEM